MNSKLDRVPGAQRALPGKTEYLPVIMIAFLILLLAAGTAFYLYRGYNLQLPAAPAPGSNLIAGGWQGWEGVDFSLQEDGNVRISQEEYYAPHLMRHLLRDETPGEVAVISARMKIESFSGQAYTLLTAYTASGPVALVVSRAEGERYRLGIIGEANQAPQYAQSAFREQAWHDLRLVLDEREGKVYGYVDGSREVAINWDGSLYPLKEIWAGAFWVGGSNAFGVPLNQVIAAVDVEEENMLMADRSFLEYLSRRLAAEPWLWIIFALIISALLAEGYLLAGRRRRRQDHDRARSGEE